MLTVAVLQLDISTRRVKQTTHIDHAVFGVSPSVGATDAVLWARLQLHDALSMISASCSRVALS